MFFGCSFEFFFFFFGTFIYDQQTSESSLLSDKMEDVGIGGITVAHTCASSEHRSYTVTYMAALRWESSKTMVPGRFTDTLYGLLWLQRLYQFTSRNSEWKWPDLVPAVTQTRSTLGSSHKLLQVCKDNYIFWSNSESLVANSCWHLHQRNALHFWRGALQAEWLNVCQWGCLE